MNRMPAVVIAVVSSALVVAFVAAPASRAQGPNAQLVSESALLTGLGGGALYPFIDSTPNRISQAHIAITDDTMNCAPGAAPPMNVQILVGQAGVALVPVMTAATNTGISNTPGQCVFHVTVNAGVRGIPDVVTDIVVVNTSAQPLGNANTITASAEVVELRGSGMVH